ncbi:HK97-gp10 family putative phage morphogenesis protein [Denitromonas halophila]|uniref:HK97 gp10 family phage protein n=1 Tax=Denitromonas halophila TaxID=1629404 RepID=A0A557QJS7_9RHOO|nr:HK97-gp10 family putative phage morphogenesis protein [Denitromonas halophila]TVO53162.1 HK97 gp10 family phage protein [Denitromonas halophila]
MLTLDTKSLSDVLKRIAQVEEKIAKKAIRTATRKAMSIVRNAAKDRAPTDSGNLSRHIALSFKVKPGVVYARVGIRGGAKKNDGTPYYWRMVEFGTKHQPAQPFMLPALETNAGAVLNTVTAELSKALDRA